MTELFASRGDPDQMSHSAASDLGLHYFLITVLGVSRLQWVEDKFIPCFRLLANFTLRSQNLVVL